MGWAKGVFDAALQTLLLELLTVVISITGPDSLACFVFFFEDGAGFGKGYTFINIGLCGIVNMR